MVSEDVADDCGCAPTDRERRGFSSVLNRRSALGLGALSVVSFSALFGGVVAPAFAATYPSWDDVEEARKNESSKASEIARIQALIQALADDVAAKQALAEQASEDFYTAQQEYFDASYRADELQSQADEQAQLALDTANKAGRVAAQLYRNGGDDTSMELFFSGSAASADDLLARLGTMDKLIERNQSVYAEAITARDSAQSLTDQAELQRAERDRLQKIAEQKMVAAQEAADAAQAALDEQTERKITLDAQLAALQDTSARTLAEYQEGERVRIEAERKAKEEAERKAKEEAERLAAAAAAAAKAAAAANSGSSGSGSSGSSSGSSGSGSSSSGSSSSSGWVRPSTGYQSSGYGARYVQCGNGYCSSGYHYGVDLAAGCGSAIYAAYGGTVEYAGYNGGYGNYIKINHGGNIGTGYAHIRSGGIFVSSGQTVSAGQLIASEGNTGNSFGCHLHFETYVNGFPVNPISFMSARGISV
ncbi:peptidoglycan DD-metalloendopeptidase family protein [Microbacterium sp. NPDC076911]|uniref:peptidoglycan DD-metalloendopeptidase family protein n=1 Tax=Microbacterium sp. NPDC076911 TaxID=3154958 RepID=UPI00343440B1